MPSQTERLELVIEAKNRATAAMKSLKNDVTEVSRALARVSGIGGAVGAIGGAVGFGAVAKGILDATMAMEQFNARLLTVYGSQSKVNVLLKDLNKFAAQTPFTLQETIDAWTRLASQGLDPTMEKMRTIGDFASSMSRSFTDAVDAVGDATRGEFERMLDFGLLKEHIDQFGKGLRNAAGTIINRSGWTDAVFKAMAARSRDSMERMMNTIGGKWSNVGDAMFRTFFAAGAPAAVPIMNILTVVTRLIESIGNKSSYVGKAFRYIFSVDRMKRFALAVGGLTLTVRHAFQTIPDILTIVRAKIATVFLSIEERIANFMAKIRAMGAAWKEGGNPLYRAMNMANAFMEGGLSVGERRGFANRRMGLRGEESLAGAGIRLRDFGLTGERAGMTKFIDSLFKGLSDVPKKMKDTLPASFGGSSGPTKSATDKVAEMILGGGELAQLGVKGSQLGALAPKKRPTVNIHVDDALWRKPLEDLVRQIVAGMARDREVAVWDLSTL